MMLKGNARGGSGDLAQHLQKDENEHVEIHELRGFAADTLNGALNEIYALSRGTSCRQFMYSLSVNPPPKEQVSTTDILDAIERSERKLGLDDQPRAIVFHEKEGRRHAHAVWSRIDTDEMKAIQLSFDHTKLVSLSRELFIEHGWQMPPGLAKESMRDPKNFTLAEWQQAKRVGKDPRAIKTAFQDAWAISDSAVGFAHALEERGYKLARGDRRSFVGVDVHGEAYSIARQTGVRTKDVRARLGDEMGFLSVSEAKNQIAEEMLPKIDDFQQQLEKHNEELRRDSAKRRKELVTRQKAQRKALKTKMEKRGTTENKERQARFRKGLGGLWDRLRGEHKRIRQQNERDAQKALVRDAQEKDALIFQQLGERRLLNILRLEVSQDLGKQRQSLQAERNLFREMRLAKDDAPKPIRRSRRNRGPAPER